MAAILKVKKYIFALFVVRSYMKCGTYMCLIGWNRCHSCSRIKNVLSNLFPDLAPSTLQRCWWYFAHSRVVQECCVKYGSNCSRFCEMAAILNRKDHIFALFSQSNLVIPTKLGRNITWGKGHLDWEYNLKWPWKMAAIVKVENCICTFSGQISPKMTWNYFSMVSGEFFWFLIIIFILW